MIMKPKPNIGWLYYKDYYSGNADLDQIDYKGKSNKIIRSKLSDYHIPDYSEIENLKKIPLKTTYPGLLLGSGYQHDFSNKDAFKIGFYFDYSLGIPVIPGSSVKGAIRSVFPFHRKNLGEDFRKSRMAYINHLLKDEIKVIDKDLSEDEIKKLEMEIFESGKDIFLDAFPKNSLKHNGKFLSDDYITAHDKPLKDPNPVKFLKVLPEVVFEFNFILQKSEVVNGLTIDNKLILLKKILLDFGVGAKTNVGYGQFVEGNNQQNGKINMTSTNRSNIKGEKKL